MNAVFEMLLLFINCAEPEVIHATASCDLPPYIAYGNHEIGRLHDALTYTSPEKARLIESLPWGTVKVPNAGTDFEPEVFYGPSQIGKTHEAKAFAKRPIFLSKRLS